MLSGPDHRDAGHLGWLGVWGAGLGDTAVEALNGAGRSERHRKRTKEILSFWSMEYASAGWHWTIIGNPERDTALVGVNSLLRSRECRRHIWQSRSINHRLLIQRRTPSLKIIRVDDRDTVPIGMLSGKQEPPYERSDPSGL
jgi:hypothetical protein